MILYAYVAARIAASPASDLFKKRLAMKGADPLYVVLFTFLFIAAVTSPVLIFSGTDSIDGAFLKNMALASVFDTAGMILIIMSLSTTDLSVFGPLNAYKPAIALFLGAFFLNEKPNAAGYAGVAVIVAGSVMLGAMKNSKDGAETSLIKSKGVWMRIAAILMFCIGVIYLKRAVLVASPIVVLFFWAAFGAIICLAGAAVFRRKEFVTNISMLRRNLSDYAGAVVIMGILQGMTLAAFGMMFVGYALALFQLSSIIDVLLGGKIFAEKNIARRLASAAVMAAGALLIVIKG